MKHNCVTLKFEISCEGIMGPVIKTAVFLLLPQVSFSEVWHRCGKMWYRFGNTAVQIGDAIKFKLTLIIIFMIY